MQRMKSPNISAPMKREAHETVMKSLDPKNGISVDPRESSELIDGPHGKVVHMHYGLEDAVREFPALYRGVVESTDEDVSEKPSKRRLHNYMRAVRSAAASALF